MQRGLKADLCFLHGHHGFFQADRGVLHLHFTLQVAGVVLGGADGAQRVFEGVAETMAVCFGLLHRLGQALGHITGNGCQCRVGALQAQVHGVHP